MSRGAYPAISVNEAAQSLPLGSVMEYFHATNGRWKLKYVKLDSTSDAAAGDGDVLYWKSRASGTVTVTAAESQTASVNDVAGVAVGTLSIGYYGWMLVNGQHPTITANGDGDIAAGDSLIGGSNASCNRVAGGTAPTHKRLAIATAADDATGVNVAGYVDVGE